MRGNLGVLSSTMKAGRTGQPEGSAGETHSALVVAETALALMLLFSAGLLLKSFVKLQEVRIRGFHHKRS